MGSPRLRPIVLEHAVPILSAHHFIGCAWATGFMIALHENSAGLGSRSASARSAVEGIAHFASLRSTKPSAMASVSAHLNAGVAILMDERQPRGAPGPLPVNLAERTRAGHQRRAAINKVHPTNTLVPPLFAIRTPD